MTEKSTLKGVITANLELSFNQHRIICTDEFGLCSCIARLKRVGSDRPKVFYIMAPSVGYLCERVRNDNDAIYLGTIRKSENVSE